MFLRRVSRRPAALVRIDSRNPAGTVGHWDFVYCHRLSYRRYNDELDFQQNHWSLSSGRQLRAKLSHLRTQIKFPNHFYSLQGAWMGLMGAGACVTRVLCPICVTAIYPVYGPWATFGFMCALMIATLFLLLVNYKRLLPYSYEEKVAAHEDESNLVPYVLRPSHL